jgi:ferrous iron transport protein A
MPISELKEGERCQVQKLLGSNHFMSRIISVGITPGAIVKVVRNTKRFPLLVYTRDSMLAINRKEASNIQVEVIE